VLKLARAIGLPIIESFKKSRSNDIFGKRISRGCGSIVKVADDSRHYTVQSLGETLDGVIVHICGREFKAKAWRPVKSIFHEVMMLSEGFFGLRSGRNKSTSRPVARSTHEPYASVCEV